MTSFSRSFSGSPSTMMMWRREGSSSRILRTFATCFRVVKIAEVSALASRVISDSGPNAEKSGWAIAPSLRMAAKPR